MPRVKCCLFGKIKNMVTMRNPDFYPTNWSYCETSVTLFKKYTKAEKIVY
jgi:hypothetical protein